MVGCCEHDRWTFRLRKMTGMSCLADGLLPSQGGLCCMELLATQWVDFATGAEFLDIIYVNL